MTNDETEKKPTDGNPAAEPDAAPAAPADTPQTAAEPEPQSSPDTAGPEPAAAETAETAAVEAPPQPEEAPETAEQPETAAEATADTSPASATDAAPAGPQPKAEAQAPAEAEVTPQPEAETKAESEAPAAAEPEPEPAAVAAPEPEPEPEPQPLRIYEYRYIRVRQNAWDEAEKAILGQGAAAAAEAGGQLYGVWSGQIGLSANQGVVVTVWTDLEAAKRNGKSAIKGIDAIAASETLYLEPTARPADATAPEGPGMFAHRVFEVRRDDIERFVELSSEAWPQFEDVFGAKVCALWRETGHDRAMERLILLTRYPDHAAWEASRFWRPDPDPKAADALARFRERRAITVDTVVYTTCLATAAAG